MAKIETSLLHSGREHNDTPSVSPPIWQTSTYRSPENSEAYLEMASAVNPPYFYHRHGAAVNNQIGVILAELEGTEAAVLTSSGMGAITTTVLALVKAGDHVITQHSVYSSVNLLFRELLPKLGVQVSQVAQTDNQAFEQAIRPNTRLLYVETPSNPNLSVTDLQFVGKLGKERGILTLCDNTFCSPINQQPARWGIDVVLHSATKYLGGHSDLTAGAVCASKQIIDQVWKHLIVMGTSLAAMDGWLLLRGIRTLSLRIKQINANALKLANYLEGHSKVKRVVYTGLPSHPQHEVAARQMTGHTGMICVHLAGQAPEEEFRNAQTVLGRLRYFTNAASLGGVESLIVHPASMWGTHHTAEQKKQSGITGGMLRISVGIENIADLLEDFEQALAN
jgi:cystathionine beta-lyase/cystathionine gamma-synthase